MNPWYTDFSDFLSRKFPGIKVQKISVDAGFSCPNRDGTISRGGCIYCNNKTFSPSYCSADKSVEQQIEEGKAFFRRKYPDMQYLAYFQAYTGTYGQSTQYLLSLYRRAIAIEGVVGLVIGTRPDCIHNQLLARLKEINSQVPVIIELGAETAHNETLRRINRGHTWQQTIDAVVRCNQAGLEVGLHLIAGLPGEDDDDVIDTVRRASLLPISSIKMHQLQIVKDTPLHNIFMSNPGDCPTYSLEHYLQLCARIVSIVPRRIAIERFVSQAPASLLVAPKWGLKNYQFTAKLHNILKNLSQDTDVVTI